jgi:hypothetical protein
MDSQLLTNSPANLIKNGNFDSDMGRRSNTPNDIIFSCWVLNGNVGLSTTSPLTGTYTLSFRGNNASAKQTLTELNKGNYTLKAWVKTVENPNIRVVITPMNSSPLTYNISNNNQFYEITVPNIQILSGVCDIKFETYNSNFSGNTRVYLDSVTFFQQSESNYAYHPDVSIDISSTNLPIMLFDVDSSFSATGNTETVMSLIYRTNGTKNRITDLNPINILDSSIIQYHGNIHLELVPAIDEKKGFILYTKDENNNYQNVNLLGLGMAHQWNLLPSNDDPTFLRGIVAGNILQGISDFNAQGAALELLINSVYQGIYIIVPQKDIAQTLEISMPYADENAFVIDINNDNDFSALLPNIDLFGHSLEDFTRYGYIFPADTERTSQMEALITQYYHTFETAVMSGTNNHSTYIDTASFYAYILSMELFRNADAYRTHLIISKKSNEKMQLNHTKLLSTTGNMPLYDVWSTEGWAWNINRFDSLPAIPFWVSVLLNNKDFYQGLCHAWGVLRATCFTDEKFDNLIDFWQARLTEARAREAKVWNHNYENTYYQLNTWEEEIAVFKQFLHQRAAWLDKQLLSPKQTNLVANGGFEADMPRNNSGELLLSSWAHEDNYFGNITLSDPFEGNRSYSFAPFVTQVITQIPAGYYQLNFHYKTLNAPLIVNLYTLDENNAPTALLFTDTLEAKNQWTEAGGTLIPFEKNIGLLQFSTHSDISGTNITLDDVSLTFAGELGIDSYPNPKPAPCKVYPNPFTQDLHFEYTAQHTKSYIKIFTTTGLQIAQMESDGVRNQKRNVLWYAPNIAPGIYFYQIQDGVHIYTGKIIKQNAYSR